MDVDRDRDGTETDWLANSVHGYGYGYTKEQALAALARHTTVDPENDSPVTVELVEHGRVFTVECFVEIPRERMADLHDAATEANLSAEHALTASETVDEYEYVGRSEGDDA